MSDGVGQFGIRHTSDNGEHAKRPKSAMCGIRSALTRMLGGEVMGSKERGRGGQTSTSMAGDLAADGGQGFGDISRMREWGMRLNLLWPSRPVSGGMSEQV
jgi:hypothetical protein